MSLQLRTRQQLNRIEACGHTATHHAEMRRAGAGSIVCIDT
jgi:hypothetical protein